jgi:catechol 2,3-dioxygenase-like lactoylglutathione lyase family enzyme
MLLALLLAVLAAPLAPQAAAPTRAAAPAVQAVTTVGFTVADLDRAVAFFRDVLQFTPVDERELAGEAYERLSGLFPVRARVARLRLGDETVELTQYLAPAGRPFPTDFKSNDRAFQHIAIVVSDMDSAYARLRRAHVTHVSSGPQRLPDWNPNAAGIVAFYFRGPDGHVLEIIAYPAGKGDARWQRKDRLFLGIDHTAIVVDDTETSLRFYRDALGLRVAGESENYGPEQERLNGVFGARLRITALRAASGPGIEFLEYLAPSDGRPYPADTRASDLLHWQTTLVSGDAASLGARLRARGDAFVSPGVVELEGAGVDARRGLTVRDPDGHTMRIVEREEMRP